jgi:hypothetical protein
VYKNIICTILEQLFSSFFLVATVYTNSFLECGQHALIGRLKQVILEPWAYLGMMQHRILPQVHI